MYFMYNFWFDSDFVLMATCFHSLDPLIFYLNCRYQKVAYLDTDVGQTEFTPPGFLSLTVIDQLTPGTCL